MVIVRSNNKTYQHKKFNNINIHGRVTNCRMQYILLYVTSMPYRAPGIVAPHPMREHGTCDLPKEEGGRRLL